MYKAWDAKDLIWAVYSYFTWKTPVVDGVIDAINDLAILVGLSKIFPRLYSTYKALGLNEAVDVLEEAWETGDEEVLTALLMAGYKDLEQKDSWERTPLLIAARDGQESMVKALLAAGANKDTQDEVSRDYGSPDIPLRTEIRHSTLLLSGITRNASSC